MGSVSNEVAAFVRGQAPKTNGIEPIGKGDTRHCIRCRKVAGKQRYIMPNYSTTKALTVCRKCFQSMRMLGYRIATVEVWKQTQE